MQGKGLADEGKRKTKNDVSRGDMVRNDVTWSHEAWRCLTNDDAVTEKRALRFVMGFLTLVMALAMVPTDIVSMNLTFILRHAQLLNLASLQLHKDSTRSRKPRNGMSLSREIHSQSQRVLKGQTNGPRFRA